MSVCYPDHSLPHAEETLDESAAPDSRLMAPASDHPQENVNGLACVMADGQSAVALVALVAAEVPVAESVPEAVTVVVQAEWMAAVALGADAARGPAHCLHPREAVSAPAAPRAAAVVAPAVQGLLQGCGERLVAAPAAVACRHRISPPS